MSSVILHCPSLLPPNTTLLVKKRTGALHSFVFNLSKLNVILILALVGRAGVWIPDGQPFALCECMGSAPTEISSTLFLPRRNRGRGMSPRDSYGWPVPSDYQSVPFLRCRRARKYIPVLTALWCRDHRGTVWLQKRRMPIAPYPRSQLRPGNL